MIGTDSYQIVIEVAENKDKSSVSDYRYSSIEITAIDNPSNNMLSENVEPLKAKFLGEGIIRLYREFEDDESGLLSQSSDLQHNKDEVSNPGDDTMVSIVAVPTYFTATDLLGFIGEPYMKHITHIRILKSEKPNRFLVLIKFDDLVKTAEFQYNFNGKPFNSMEQETCHVVFVKSIKFDYSTNNLYQINDAGDSLIPFLLLDPFTSPPVSYPNSPNSKPAGRISLSSSNRAMMELPSCPVCLERMDATITGLLTIPCQHTFHCQCLSKWKDDTCPICRYSNNVSNQKIRRTSRRLSQFNLSRRQQVTSPPTSSNLQNLSATTTDVDATDECMECETKSNLWICLICGNVGCDRYAPEQHSLRHFVNTGHCFAMELNTSRVWDYAGDNYVHRLITNESDGKLVELPDKGYGLNSSASDENPKLQNSNIDKIDQVGFEYSQLLISQLASQRDYYESLLQEKDSPKSRRGSSIATINQNVISDLEMKVKNLTEKFSDLSTNTIPSLKNKIISKDEKINKVSKELNTSNLLNDALSTKIEFLTKSNKELQNQIKDLTEQNTSLSEQVTDLMFFLDSQEKFKNESQEVKDGTIVIQQHSTSSKKSRPKKKKK